jgi:hypothetical protein
MRVSRKAILTSLLGLMLTVSAAGMAQTTTQNDQKKSEACCSTDSCCCCSGDSCDMKAKHDAKNHSGKNTCCNMKQKDAKNKDKNKQKAA